MGNVDGTWVGDGVGDWEGNSVGAVDGWTVGDGVGEKVSISQL